MPDNKKERRDASEWCGRTNVQPIGVLSTKGYDGDVYCGYECMLASRHLSSSEVIARVNRATRKDPT